MRGASKDERLFTYGNRQGIRAMGMIVDANIQEGQGIFIDNRIWQCPESGGKRNRHILPYRKPDLELARSAPGELEGAYTRRIL